MNPNKNLTPQGISMCQFTLPPTSGNPTCSHPGCTSESKHLGFCNMHYIRQHKGKPMDRKRMKGPLLLRFPQNFTKGKEDECWPWIGWFNQNGYGQIKDGHKHLLAHRVAYALNIGDIPNGMCVLHKCDNPACVNPNHLRLGTKKENNLDKVIRDRCAKGQATNIAKITPEQVVEIRTRRCAGETLSSIGKDFGLGTSQIWRITKNQSWTHV